MTTATGVCDDLERKTTAGRDMANNVAARKKELADTIEESKSAARSNQRAVDDVKHSFNQAHGLHSETGLGPREQPTISTGAGC
ncbi:hypothetical protein THAOC_06973, partial [Thalassiosira oceanica]